ncbi:AMP-binding protein [Amycolatopsis sp. NBC_01480]|uniref:AMP-binding protein n=1 Tax=Amycolatopsis sp. NBC_01480 TaxID=2903562 RepID=UPI002E2820DE|nr:AMP-binding protein [Amycolatopsis sp. NBC_01480]
MNRHPTEGKPLTTNENRAARSEWGAALSGCSAGDRVVIRHPGGEPLAALLIACLEANLVAVPVHPRTDDDELAAIAERVSASLIVDGESGTTELAGRPSPEATGLALIIFTSGSTGRPKGVKLSRDAVLGNARKTAQLHRITPERPHGTCLPLFHVNALVMSLYGTYLTGSSLVLDQWRTPEGYFALLDAKGARTASIVPALLTELVEAAPPWPGSLDYLISAAAPITSDLAARFHELYGPRLRQGFGLTETINFSTLMPLLDDAGFVKQYVEAKPPAGLPVPGTELRIEDGEVWIRSPEMMSGYWEDPETTAKTLGADGWLRSGDLGELRDGYLVLHGRRTELINRGGEKYYPLALEGRWRRAGLSGTFAAVPVPEPSLGTEIGLVLDGQPVTAAKELVLGRGPRPAAVQSGDFLATSTGKPQRTRMGKRLAVKRDNAQRYPELLDYAASAARAVLAGARPGGGRAAVIHDQARALAGARQGAPGGQSFPRTAAHDCLDLLVESWPAIAAGSATGDDLMHGHRGLWKRLMTEWPMVSYADAMVDVLRAGDFLRGRVLELGSGVGNTSVRVAGLVDGEFVFSDRVAGLVERGGWPGRGVVYDLDDAEPPAGLGRFDTILATNVLHCVADKRKTLAALRSSLSEGGRLVLAEGAGTTDPAGTPWALDFLFSLWDGWWDRGGFADRWEWLALLDSAGLREPGFSVLRAGEHDLGGVVWARG